MSHPLPTTAGENTLLHRKEVLHIPGCDVPPTRSFELPSPLTLMWTHGTSFGLDESAYWRKCEENAIKNAYDFIGQVYRFSFDYEPSTEVTPYRFEGKWGVLIQWRQIEAVVTSTSITILSPGLASRCFVFPLQRSLALEYLGNRL